MNRRRRRFYTSALSSFDYDSCGIVGFTDLVSNTVVLDDISPMGRRKEIVDGALDLKFMANIAHEAAHHACLETPVGSALGSLWQSSFTLWWEGIGTNLPQQPARDLAIASAASIVFQPLLEGLAVFCEHDLTTGDGHVISRVTQRVAALFSKGRIPDLFSDGRELARCVAEIGPQPVFSRGHTEILRLARLSNDWTERKRLLLSQPLKDKARYLLGYLAVKGIYGALITRCPDLADPELFFVTIVRHFLHDKVLSEIMLRFRNQTDDPRKAYSALNVDIDNFLTRFQDMLQELYADTANIAKTAVEHILRPTSAEEERVVSANDSFARLRTVGTFNIAWPHLLEHRQEFRFSFQPVVIRLTQDGTASIAESSGSREILRVQAVKNCLPAHWKPGESDEPFEGSIEAVQLRETWASVVCVLAHDGLVAVFDCDSGEWNRADLVEKLDHMPSAVAVEGAMHAFHEWQSRTRGEGDVRNAIAYCEEQANQAVDLIYRQLMCHGKQARGRDRVAAAFDARGIYSIYAAEDEDLLARLSLAAGLFNSLRGVADTLELEVDQVVAHAKRYNDIARSTCGYEPFMLTDTHIGSRI
ncbi:hypothetical protein GOD44_12570 [Sinorhizobium medicae]|nr:hypothetical protein [Sinorhizobium medicae]